MTRIRFHRRMFFFRFGESTEPSDVTAYVENELKVLSEEENKLFNLNYQSWIHIEQARERFYQEKIGNHGLHFHSQLLQSLSDASQIDQEISNLSFARSFRPFLFEMHDERQFLQLIIHYLHLINALPAIDLLQQILNQWKISLSNHLSDQLFLENEFLQLSPLIHPTASIRTEERFSVDYISRVYERLLVIPSLKAYKLEFLLLYWYYLAENVRELKQQSKQRFFSLVGHSHL